MLDNYPLFIFDYQCGGRDFIWFLRAETTVLPSKPRVNSAFVSSEILTVNASFLLLFDLLNVHFPLIPPICLNSPFPPLPPINRNTQERDLSAGGGRQSARAAQEAHGPEAENEGSQPRL